jgi:hypothetical protein
MGLDIAHITHILDLPVILHKLNISLFVKVYDSIAECLTALFKT